MERKLLTAIEPKARVMGLPPVLDTRAHMPTNPNGRKYKTRVLSQIEGVCFHQAAGAGTLKDIGNYHVSKNSHLARGGMESIAYSLGIEKDGTIAIVNDLEKRTWSQGTRSIKGDENELYIAVVLAGDFKGTGHKGKGQPTYEQVRAFMVVWEVLRDFFNLAPDAIYGHFDFGKPACPGECIQSLIESIRGSAKGSTDTMTIIERQESLQKLGQRLGKVDGIWGKNSKAALISFQMANGLDADGKWGPKTEAKIKQMLAKQ